ncbi:uncharacterized protein [Embiotoca jacksoni]|uniref:uncharacterized protein isoform X2 n=1 Tax=Embiotoca jacksoni TaxID=100190 RepID=UPI003704C72A
MSNVSVDESPHVSKVWIALRRLDKNDERVVALREVSINAGAEVTMIIQIINSTFGLSSSNIILKIRNHRGHLMPLNSSIPANSKHIPYVLEVAKIFQHAAQEGERGGGSSRNVVQIHRLDNLLPQIKLRHDEKLTQEIECLSQKLRFLHKRMQVADSHSWKGMLTRAPLW